MHFLLGTTVHFLQDWKRLRAMLACKEFPDRHISENIVQQFNNAIELFNLREKKISFISTDSASNMVKAFEVNLSQFIIDENNNNE